MQRYWFEYPLGTKKYEMVELVTDASARRYAGLKGASRATRFINQKQIQVYPLEQP